MEMIGSRFREDYFEYLESRFIRLLVFEIISRRIGKIKFELIVEIKMKQIFLTVLFVFNSLNFGQEFISAAQFADIRCHSESTEQVYFQWKGYAYAQFPSQREKLLFEVLGMNVGRCLPYEDGYNLVTRELQFYLDPATSEVVDFWTNPWSGEEVAVMHTANSPVQIDLPSRRSIPLDDLGPTKSVGYYIPIINKNPLYDLGFREYAPQEWYQASEMFRFTFLPENPQSVGIIWHRVGQFLPWMKMGEWEGQLKIVAHGQRLNSFQDLDLYLQKLIRSRVPGYENAPRCFRKVKNATSWTEFKKHYDAYLNKEIFPKDVEEMPCLQQ